MTLKVGDKCLVFPEGVCVECKAPKVGDTVVAVPVGGQYVAKKLRGKVGNGVYALPTASGKIAVQGKDQPFDVPQYLEAITDASGYYTVHNSSGFLGNTSSYCTLDPMADPVAYVQARWSSEVDLVEVSSVRVYWSSVFGSKQTVLDPNDYIYPNYAEYRGVGGSWKLWLNFSFIYPNIIRVENPTTDGSSYTDPTSAQLIKAVVEETV